MNKKYEKFLDSKRTVEYTYAAGLYIRLSCEDGDKQESNSVASQRAILTDYISSLPDATIYDYYIDDGFSGTSFDRPAFKEMMEAVYAGDINCVIVKDLSRFGRNYADSAKYIDEVFPRFNVRFIALNNGIDSASNNMNAATQCISVGVTNVINESYAATTSVNVRATLDMYRKQGKFIGSFATYGYKKDPEDHHHLIIDEEAAEVVREIYEKFVAGTSIIGIAKYLNSQGVPNPSAYKKQHGFNINNADNDGLWHDRTIRRILKNEIYIGNMVQGKFEKISYKIHKCREVSKDNWYVIENTHEPIITHEIFHKAQSLFNRGIRTKNPKGEVDLFAGFLKCNDCGKAMSKKVYKNPNRTYVYYKCSTRRKKADACSNHTIRLDILEKAVLVTIQKYIEVAVDMAETMKIINASTKKIDTSHITTPLNRSRAEIRKCDELLLGLYPDFKAGIISKEEFLSLKEKIAINKEQLIKQVENLEKKLSVFTNKIESSAGLESFKKYQGITELSRKVLVEFVDKIRVHENGEITIDFKFADEFSSAKEFIEQNTLTKNAV